MRSPKRSTARKIPLTTVVERVRAGKCTPEELRDWFSIDVEALADIASASHGLSDIEINRDRVDVGGLESLARFGATALAADAVKAVTAHRRAPPAGATRRSATPGVPIVAEGDSWFNLPDPRFPLTIPPTLVDFLARRWQIENIAHWGDTLDQIVASRQYADHLTQDTRIFLFSAGGNDALGGGNLFRLLRQRRSGDNDPRNASLYLRPEFHDLIDAIEGKISRFVKAVMREFPNVRILMHGYDFAIPRPNGFWLGSHLQRRGFDPLWQPDFCKAIVKLMVQRFNACLDSVARRHPNFHHVDLTGTVKERWWDELHPDADGAKALSERYEAAMMKLAAGSSAEHVA